MVYTGEEVAWADVPNIIEAHKINFMGDRIPVGGRFNITAWRSYLAEYWDR